MGMTGSFNLKDGTSRLFTIKICETCKKAGKLYWSERDRKPKDRPTFTFSKGHYLPTVYHSLTNGGRSTGFLCYRCIESIHLIGPEEVGSSTKGL